MGGGGREGGREGGRGKYKNRHEAEEGLGLCVCVGGVGWGWGCQVSVSYAQKKFFPEKDARFALLFNMACQNSKKKSFPCWKKKLL